MGLIKGIINGLANPKLFFVLAVLALVVLVWKRDRVTSKSVGYGVLGLLSLFFIFGTCDPTFRLMGSEQVWERGVALTST